MTILFSKNFIFNVSGAFDYFLIVKKYQFTLKTREINF